MLGDMPGDRVGRGEGEGGREDLTASPELSKYIINSPRREIIRWQVLAWDFELICELNIDCLPRVCNSRPVL